MSSSSFVDRPLCVASLVVMVGRIVLGLSIVWCSPQLPVSLCMYVIRWSLIVGVCIYR